MNEASTNAKGLRRSMVPLYGDNLIDLRLKADPYTEIDLLIDELREVSRKEKS